MEEKRLKYLIDVNKSQKATLEEREELELWYSGLNDNPDATDLLDEKAQRAVQSRIWRHLIKNPKLSTLVINAPKQVALFRTFLFKAAMVVLIMGLGFYYYIQRDADQQNQSKQLVDIQPGGNNATLTLADGSIIDLKSIEEGKVIVQNGLSITKTEDGTITYERNKADQNSNPKFTFNTISTPRGGQYKVILPDGTLVWLNAASSLTYPTKFNDSGRNVQLSGEAYFEVSKRFSKDGKTRAPFNVRTRDQVVEVVGTHFNVKAYEDERETITTLLEGKVNILGLDEGTLINKRTLKVGEAASWSSGSKTMEVSNIDVQKAIAWKNGKFIFSGENITKIMKEVSRWYDVDVSYQGNLSHVNFEGSLSRYENISEILRKLELTGTVHFKIIQEGDKERRIIVMQ